MTMLKKSLCFIFAIVFVFSGTILFSACKKKPDPEIYSATIDGLKFQALRTNWGGEFIDDCYYITLDFSVENITEDDKFLNETLLDLETKKPFNFGQIEVRTVEGNPLSPDDVQLNAGEILNFNINFHFQPTDSIESLVNENTFICKYKGVIFARMKIEGSVIR